MSPKPDGTPPLRSNAGNGSPENFAGTTADVQAWITRNLGWFPSSVVVLIFIFMA